MSDIHHGSDSRYVKGTVALPLLDEALKAIQQEKPALLVDLGDRINDTESAGVQLREVAACFHKLPIPKVHLLGNHDVTDRCEQEAVLGTSLVNRSLELGGWQLIFLYTFDGSVSGCLTPTDLRWLECILAANPLPTVVFTHQPLDGQPMPDNFIFKSTYLEQAHPKGHKAARQIMEASGKVVLAVNGHTHWNHSERINGVSYLTVDSLTPRESSQNLEGSYGFLRLARHEASIYSYGRASSKRSVKVAVGLSDEKL